MEERAAVMAAVAMVAEAMVVVTAEGWAEERAVGRAAEWKVVAMVMVAAATAMELMAAAVRVVVVMAGASLVVMMEVALVE